MRARVVSWILRQEKLTVQSQEKGKGGRTDEDRKTDEKERERETKRESMTTPFTVESNWPAQ